jgi:hypothetical protein
MTRQKSRPAKQKHRKTHHKSKTQQPTIASLDAFMCSPFEPSLALKSLIISKRKDKSETESTWQPRPGALFSSGKCIIGTKKGRDNYTVRITNKSAAQSILKLEAGTRIRLKNAKFINSYGSKKYREISASSFEVITDTPREKNSATPATKIFIYPDLHGTKQKKGVTHHKPICVITVTHNQTLQN